MSETVKSEKNPVASLSLSLISSHNDLLPPKSRQIYPQGDLHSSMGLVRAELGGGGLPDHTNPKWYKEGQNQLRKAAEHVKEDQNCNPDTENSDKDWANHNEAKHDEISALNCANLSALQGTPLLIQLPPGEDEDDVTPAKSELTDPFTAETSELSSDLLDLQINEGGKETSEGTREGGRSASLLFGMRNNAGSDEDSSWATLSQGSPSYSSPDDTDGFWTRNSLDTDSDLPSGWMRVQDTSGTYYWHIPTGTTQWEPPSELCNGEHKLYPLSDEHTPNEEETYEEELADIGQSEEEGTSGPEHLPSISSCTPTEGEEEDPQSETCCGAQTFPVCCLGWVEMTEEDLAPGRSSIAVNGCIRQLSLHSSSHSQVCPPYPPAVNTAPPIPRYARPIRQLSLHSSSHSQVCPPYPPAVTQLLPFPGMPCLSASLSLHSSSHSQVCPPYPPAVSAQLLPFPGMPALSASCQHSSSHSQVCPAYPPAVSAQLLPFPGMPALSASCLCTAPPIPRYARPIRQLSTQLLPFPGMPSLSASCLCTALPFPGMPPYPPAV
uniref:WW domain-containing protein n=1 Tax=Xenopus tropicalis TaxID=8364 RepID=A0A803JE31_XENTR